MINFRIVPLALVYGVEAIAMLLAAEEASHDTRDPVRPANTQGGAPFSGRETT
jgi:hypothetical protein